MKLIRDEIMAVVEAEEMLRKSMNLKKFENDVEFQIVVADIGATGAIARKAETIILSSDVFMQLVNTSSKIDLRNEFLLPYPNLIVQLTEPILEKHIMPYPEQVSQVKYLPGNVQMVPKTVKDDRISAVLLHNPFQDPANLVKNDVFQSALWFTSLSMDRSGWILDRMERTPTLVFSKLVKNQVTSRHYANKLKIVQIAYALSLFLNAPNVYTQRQIPNKKINDKRQKKGKAPIPEYHTVYIKKIHVEYESKKGTGTSHGHMYPVRGHFRKYKHLDKPVWIPNHYRGLQHGEQSLKKEVYKVRKEGTTSNEQISR